MRLVYSSPLKLSFVLRSPSGIWNKTTNAWEALPATGIPTTNHLIPLAASATAGSLKNEQTATVPTLAVDSVPEIWASVFKLKADGTLAGDPSDLQSVDGLPSSSDVFIQVRGGAVK
jgi:hypothetical protein